MHGIRKPRRRVKKGEPVESAARWSEIVLQTENGTNRLFARPPQKPGRVGVGISDPAGRITHRDRICARIEKRGERFPTLPGRW